MSGVRYLKHIIVFIKSFQNTCVNRLKLVYILSAWAIISLIFNSPGKIITNSNTKRPRSKRSIHRGLINSATRKCDEAPTNLHLVM